MKIDGNNEILRNTVAGKAGPKEVNSDAEFKDILKASVEQSKEQPAKIESALQPNPIAAIRFTPVSPESKNINVESVDNLLELLDQYKDQLADPTVTLKTIEPLLNTIAKERDQLAGDLENLPKGDRLQDIAHRTLITASLEVMKFNRGDYITT
jgi:hypothetical protein